MRARTYQLHETRLRQIVNEEIQRKQLLSENVMDLISKLVDQVPAIADAIKNVDLSSFTIGDTTFKIDTQLITDFYNLAEKPVKGIVKAKKSTVLSRLFDNASALTFWTMILMAWWMGTSMLFYTCMKIKEFLVGKEGVESDRELGGYKPKWQPGIIQKLLGPLVSFGKKIDKKSAGDIAKAGARGFMIGGKSGAIIGMGEKMIQKFAADGDQVMQSEPVIELMQLPEAAATLKAGKKQFDALLNKAEETMLVNQQQYSGKGSPTEKDPRTQVQPTYKDTVRASPKFDADRSSRRTRDGSTTQPMQTYRPGARSKEEEAPVPTRRSRKQGQD